MAADSIEREIVIANIEHRPGKPVELRGFEPLTPSMRKIYSCSCCQ
jgi:hypothetical protein